jgi:signal transduction histidine kinase/NO-binding membrane sensor protein with MHYT domain
VLKILYTCITEEHDIRLVVLAGFVCLFASLTAINFLVRAREVVGSRRLAPAAAAAAVFGAGVWTMHFVAELGFKPGLPIAYDSGLTGLSLLIAVVLTALGLFAAARLRSPTIGGFIIGAAIGGAHYVGIMAMRAPAETRWDLGYVALSLGVGIVLAGAAMRLAWQGPAWRYRLWATMLFVTAICGLHFTAMAAVALIPDPHVPMPAHAISPELLVQLVAAATLGVMTLGLSSSMFEEHLDRCARDEAELLRRSKDHLARAQRIAQMGSFERDLRTDQTIWSDETYRILGLDPNSPPPSKQDLLALVHTDDRAMMEASMAASEHGLVPPPAEFRLLLGDGRIKWIYVETDVIFDNKGNALRRIGAVRDVTELRAARERQKELERQLMHSQKLEALGTLAGGVAHDLNNTLVPIVALSKLVLDELPETSPLRGDIATIIRASERARGLVGQILAFSRKQDLVKQEVDLPRVAREALQMLRATLPATIQLIELISEVPLLYGDPGHLHQVVVNLVTNAAQAIGDGVGKITVRLWAASEMASARPAEDTANAPVVYLSVSDTGCGMDRATLDRVFEPFFTTKEVGMGTGLGLSVVHGIVTSYGGTITVRSKPGEGSEFTLSLPALDRRPQAAQVDALAA